MPPYRFGFSIRFSPPKISYRSTTPVLLSPLEAGQDLRLRRRRGPRHAAGPGLRLGPLRLPFILKKVPSPCSQPPRLPLNSNQMSLLQLPGAAWFLAAGRASYRPVFPSRLQPDIPLPKPPQFLAAGHPCFVRLPTLLPVPHCSSVVPRRWRVAPSEIGRAHV